MLIIFFLLLFHLIFGLLIENVKRRELSITLNMFFIGVVMAFTLGITYTADWIFYYWNYKIEGEDTDFIFYQLTKVFNSYNLEYTELFMFHIICSLLLYFILITRFTRNYFYVFLIYMMLDYVHYTNQIRYYLGFPILIYAFYTLFYRKKYILSLTLITLSLLCHSGLTTLLIFIPLYYFVSTKNFIKIMLLSSLVVAVFMFFVMQGGLGLVINHYDSYFGKDYDSSFVGGVFNAIPYIVYYTFLLVEYGKLTNKKYIDKNNPMYELLMKLTFFSLLFLPGSFFLQILGHRYIMPFAIFWIIFYLYLIKDLPQKKRLFKMIIFSVVHFIAIFSIYILPDLVLPKNHFLKELEKTIQSIPYFENWFF